jgi:hypothetical protein
MLLLSPYDGTTHHSHLLWNWACGHACSPSLPSLSLLFGVVRWLSAHASSVWSLTSNWKLPQLCLTLLYFFQAWVVS